MTDSRETIMQKQPKTNPESIKVVIKCRPMNAKEVAAGNKRILSIYPDKGVVSLLDPKSPTGHPSVRQFTFDSVYDSNTKQTDFYDETVRPLVDSVLVGFNGTVFAYGQTGAGKTYTMEGIQNDVEKKGVIPNAFDHIFNHISCSQNIQYLVTVSYLEIYQEEIRDLLSKDPNKKCEIKEKPHTGIYVKDLTVYVCKNVMEIEHIMFVGNQNRSVGATNMNIHSSRSHAIFMMTVEHADLGLDKPHYVKMGKLNLVDLAGSERQSKTGAEGDRQKESIKINLSLSALGNVISSLVDGKSTHIPYRDSKLTRLLQDSLGGNARTVMIANVGPSSYNFDETLTTLRYANQAKRIKNRPQINEDPKEALLKEFQTEIARLKAQLAAKAGKRKKKRSARKIIPAEFVNDPDDEESEEAYLKEQEARLTQEHLSILNDQNLIAAEKDELLKELTIKQEQLKTEQEARDRLLLRIQAMESKLLRGGKNIIDHTNKQQRELEQRRQELAEQKRVERTILQKLEMEEESTLEVKETYTSLQQEVEIKTRKLKKLFIRLQTYKQEIAELQEMNCHERQERENISNHLMKQLKLTYVVIENFIPLEEKSKILSRICFDDEEDCWIVKMGCPAYMKVPTRRPIATPHSRRPVTQGAMIIGNFGNHPRYCGENILSPTLDLPERLTRKYKHPKVGPMARAALDAALKGEEDVDIDARLFCQSMFTHRPRTSKKSSKSRAETSRPSKGKKDGKDEPHYPETRGLVPK